MSIIGYTKGEICNRDGCNGIIKDTEKDGSCICHVINPPCSYCTTQTEYCEVCGWDAQEEQYEYDKRLSEYYKNKPHKQYV